jgi:hypothetical protein
VESIFATLWPVLLGGGIGRFIDFLLGKQGDQAVKTFMTGWWIRFDDVQWYTFGKAEAAFSLNVMTKTFGKYIWSLRRICFIAAVVSIFGLSGYFITLIYRDTMVTIQSSTPISLLHWVTFEGLDLYVVGLFIGCSSTRWLSLLFMRLTGDDTSRRNAILYVMTLLLFYVMLVKWLPLMEQIHNSVDLFRAIWNSTGFRGDLRFSVVFWGQLQFALLNMLNFDPLIHPLNAFHDIQFKLELDRLTPEMYISSVVKIGISYLPALFRFALAAIFMGSFLLKPLVMRPLNLIWRRIIESDKPVFTVVFGGVGAIISAVHGLTP